MSSEVSLHKLVKVLVSKKTSPKVFAVLVKQLLQNGPVSDQELAESLMEIPHSSDPVREKCRIEYTLEYACSSVAYLQRFMKLLSHLSFHSQRAYLVFLKNNYSQLFKLNTLKEFVRLGFIPYTSAIASALSENLSLDSLQNSVWTHTIFLWGDIIDNHADIISPVQFKELSILVMSVLVKFNISGLSAYFTRKANSLMNTTDLSKELQSEPTALHTSKYEKVTMSSVKKSYSLNLHSKKGTAYLRLKKFMWLNSQFQQWQHQNLVDGFLQYFGITTHKLVELIEDIIGAFFGGISVAIKLKESPYVVFNWKNFIVSRLPILLKDSKAIRSCSMSENLGEILAAAVAKFNEPVITQMKVGGFQDKPYDLRTQFLRSCIYRDLITLDIFTRLFPEKADFLSHSLIVHETEQLSHIDNITNELNSKLLSVNTEFTSLEESKLIDYFQSLPHTNLLFLDKRQKQLNKLIHNAVDTLIKDRSNEKLSRLMIAMANSLPVSNYIFFNDPHGPWGLLNKLISYVDKESFRVDDDDSNFQDTYSYFGVILSGIIAITVFFGVDFKLVDIKDSYTANFINKFFHRHCDDLTSKAASEDEYDSTIVSNYNKLLQDWVNALFDVNNEGLSDDLIKSINVKQTYKLITIIFQQAVTANIVGTLSASGLNNGLDYLSQNFLAPCSLEIMQWILSHIGPLQSNSQAMVLNLLRIIETNVANTGGVNDPNYSFRVILNILGTRTIKKIQSLKDWKSIDAATKTIAILHNELDPEYTYNKSPILPQEGMFDLAQTMKQSLGHYLREPATADTLLIAWEQIRHGWQKLASQQCLFAFLQELDQCLKLNVNHGDTEEAKIYVDVLVFLIVASSGQKYEESLATQLAAHVGTFPASNNAPPSHHKFSLTIDNHFSSIFNEVAPPSPDAEPEKPSNYQLAADFEMDDLFNDVADDLFGDTVPRVLGTVSRRTCSPPVNMGLHHKSLRDAYSTMKLFEQKVLPLMNSRGCEKRLGEIARMKLAHELEHWMHAFKGQR